MSASDYALAIAQKITWPEVDALEKPVIAIIPDFDVPEQLRAARFLYEQTVNQDEYVRFEKTMTSIPSEAVLRTPSSPRCGPNS